MTKTSVVIAPIAVADSAIRDALEAAAPRDLTGKRENPVSNLLSKAEIGWTMTRGALGVGGRPDALAVTTTLNGPSCSGNVTGDEVLTPMKVGDIAVIPAGIPHGWTGITTEVTYLSVRPDPKKVLEHGYVNPAIK